MVRWQIYVGGTQRGSDYDNEKRAIQNADVIARSNRQVYVYKVVNSNNPVQVAKSLSGLKERGSFDGCLSNLRCWKAARERLH